MNNHLIRHSPAHHAPHLWTDHPTILFVTQCIKGRRPLLANQFAHDLLVEVWQLANAWQVGQYVIMPDHLHFFCAPFDLHYELRQWMIFWRNEFTKKWPHKEDKPIWQRDYWDTQLRRGESYSAKWDYVRLNPVRKGLSADTESWPFMGEIIHLPWRGE
jgi:putative transposase